MKQTKKPYQWKQPKTDSLGNIVDNNGDILFEFIDPERIILTPLDQYSFFPLYLKYDILVLDENNKQVILKPGFIKFYLEGKQEKPTEEQEMGFKELIAGALGFSEKIMKLEAEEVHDRTLFAPVSNNPTRSNKYKWAGHSLKNHVSGVGKYFNQNIKLNADKVIDDFFAIIQENPEDVPQFSTLHEFMAYAMTFQQKNYHSHTILENKNCVEMVRYLPRFLDQSDFNTLHDFIENSDLYTRESNCALSIEFVANNAKHIAKQKVYKDLLEMERSKMDILINSIHVIPASGNVDVNLFDLTWFLETCEKWGTSIEIRKAALKSFVELYEFAEENAEEHDKESVVMDISKIQNDVLGKLPSLGFISRVTFHNLISIELNAIVQNSPALDPNKIESVYNFLINKEIWVKSDPDHLILRYMFHTLSYERILEIALTVETNESLRDLTVNNWFKYLTNHEEYSGMPLEWALDIANKS